MSSDQAGDGGPPAATVLAMNLVADAGKQMLESSSSVSEVLARLRRFLAALGLEDCSLDANMSSILVSYWRPEWRMPVTTMREVTISEPRLERLAGAEALLDEVERGDLALADAVGRLRDLESSTGRGAWTARAAVLVSVLGWLAFLHGLTTLTVAVALLATVLTFPVAELARRIRLPTAAEAFAVAVIIAAVPNLLAAAGLAIRLGPAVVAPLFIYLPGRALVSAVIDGLANAPLSAVSRGLQAVVVAGSLAVGMLVGTEVGAGLGLQYQPDLAGTPLVLSTLGASAGVLGLAAAWGMPREMVLPTAAIGAVAWLCFSAATDGGEATDWVAYGLAAGVVGLSAIPVSLLSKMTPSVYTGVAILPLVPGFTLYRGVLAISQGESQAAESAFGKAAVIALAIAVGLAVGLAVSREVRTMRRPWPTRRAVR
jgi:uncharacterized membrane protein YjjP (DUF1212 family)